MAEVIEKTFPLDHVETTEEDAAAKSDIEDHEMDEVDKNGDSAAPQDTSKLAEETEEEKSIRACRQIEFYFADSNLPYDKFMWTLHTKTPEHWVPIKTVASFKRMREFSSKGSEWMLDALRRSETLEVDEKGENLRRRTEVKEPTGQFERSIYAKGFGKEEPELQQKLEEYFNTFGRFNAVRMRRNNDTREFKGSVFVEFADLSTAERFLASDPKPSWSGQELLIMSKDAYCQMKIKEKGLKGKAAQYRREKESGNGLRKGFNAFRPETFENGNSKEKKADYKKPDVILDFMGSKLTVIDEDGGKVDEASIPYVKNSALKVTGIEGDISFDDVKKPLKERFEYAPFIKYEKGASEGLVGFSKGLSEEDISFVKEAVKSINGKEVKWVPAEESEERAFLIERAQNAARRVLSIASRNTGRGGKVSRGGRGAARGRGRGRGGRRDGGDSRSSKDKPNSKHAQLKSPEANDTSREDGEQAGGKRKRGSNVEPDGPADAGVRGAGIPSIQSAPKKVKPDGETPSS